MTQLDIENLSWFYEGAFFIVCLLLFVMHLFCTCVCNKTKCLPKNDVMDYHNQTGFLIALTILIVLLIVINNYLKIRRKHISLFIEQERQRNANQTGDVWNISGRVARERPVTSEPSSRWPTHDNHVSIDTFVIPEHFQPYKIDKIPPPPYCEVDLPTYAQATINPKDTTVIPSVHVTPSPSSSRVEN